MNKKLLAIPALALASLAISPAHAIPVTSVKDVTVHARSLKELTNNGEYTLMVMARPGPNRDSEATPMDNGIVEHVVKPGEAALVEGPYVVREYLPAASRVTGHVIDTYPLGGD